MNFKPMQLRVGDGGSFYEIQVHKQLIPSIGDDDPCPVHRLVVQENICLV